MARWVREAAEHAQAGFFQRRPGIPELDDMGRQLLQSG